LNQVVGISTPAKAGHISFDGISTRSSMSNRGSCMMFAEMCVVWQESQQCLPCRLAKTGFKDNGEGRCRIRCSQQEEVFLPSCVRLDNQAGKLTRQHISHKPAAHPPHLITFTSISRPLIASSFCSHTNQARGMITVTYSVLDDKRIKQKSRTLDKTACTPLIQKGPITSPPSKQKTLNGVLTSLLCSHATRT
jgi:hypothetical protein